MCSMSVVLCTTCQVTYDDSVWPTACAANLCEIFCSQKYHDHPHNKRGKCRSSQEELLRAQVLPPLVEQDQRLELTFTETIQLVRLTRFLFLWLFTCSNGGCHLFLRRGVILWFLNCLRDVSLNSFSFFLRSISRIGKGVETNQMNDVVNPSLLDLLRFRFCVGNKVIDSTAAYRWNDLSIPRKHASTVSLRPHLPNMSGKCAATTSMPVAASRISPNSSSLGSGEPRHMEVISS